MSEDISSAYLEFEINSQTQKANLSGDRPCRIGRTEGNSIVLDDDMASRNHVIVQASESGIYTLTDLGSTNGTLLNGARVTAPVILRPGDLIQIGSHTFTFHQEKPAVAKSDPMVQKATSLFVSMRVISVLVVDIRDFTGLAQRIGSERLGKVAGALFRESGHVLQQHKAWAQKYIGDAVMAVWLHHTTVAEVGELIQVFSALDELNAIAGLLQTRFHLDAPIRIGAGINTGAASIGNFGSIAASDHTALGEVVNKAFRLESASKEIGCDVVLGQESYNLAAKSPVAAAIFRPSTIMLKGYSEPATVYGAGMH